MTQKWTDLNMSTDHCKLKGLDFAVQELVANAIDANRKSGELPEVTMSGKTLKIADQGDGLERRDFRLGQTDGEAGTIGSFGVGLLDAVAIIMRCTGHLSVRSRCSEFCFRQKDESIQMAETRCDGIRGTEWTIPAPVVGLEGIKERFLVFHKLKPFVDTGALQVYVPRLRADASRERGRLFINGMAMRGVENLMFHYNFTREDASSYGREHTVTPEKLKVLQEKIQRVYEAHKRQFYDRQTRGGELSTCEESKWQFMSELFSMTEPPPHSAAHSLNAVHQDGPNLMDGWGAPRPMPTNLHPVQPACRVKPAPPKQQVHIVAHLHKEASKLHSSAEKNSRLINIRDSSADEIPSRKGKKASMNRVADRNNDLATCFMLGQETDKYHTAERTLVLRPHIADKLKEVCKDIGVKVRACEGNDVEIKPPPRPSHGPSEGEVEWFGLLMEQDHFPVTTNRYLNVVERRFGTAGGADTKDIKEMLEEVARCPVVMSGSAALGTMVWKSDRDFVITCKDAGDRERIRKAFYKSEFKVFNEREAVAKGAVIMNMHYNHRKLDVSLGIEGGDRISTVITKQERAWWEDKRKTFRGVEKVVRALKVWVMLRHPLGVRRGLKGAALTCLAVICCERMGPKAGEVDLSDVFRAVMEHLVELAKVPLAKREILAQYPPGDNLVGRVSDADWESILKAARLQLKHMD
eukprot:Hpha_TRINITY_DN8420_c0_g1::TRINITY_DN8420_c0_g1_i1::g.34715::m.34715